eukprot:TRINITY_DN13003_c3_g1_i1.p1 TRINITY_DN13003_c3_g1~~TRINITY_DN13003_c3_g1_i1.p1  ORF type:complete len:248 (-),score=46.96 TRINITY_DN13003_c3_g1_i1:130-873(-)
MLGGTGANMLAGACAGMNPWTKSWAERLSASSDCWEPLPQVGEGAGTHVAAAAGGGHVYAFGGLRDGKASDQALRLDLYSGLWEELPALNNPRFECAAVIARRKCYVIGGASASGKALASTECLDPAKKSNRWQNMPAMNQARFGCAATVSASGAIFVIGGLYDGTSLAVVEKLEPGKWWELLEPMPTPRHRCGAASTGGRVFVFGGSQDEQALPVVECFDLTSKKWIALEPLNEAWGRCCAASFHL